MEIVVVVLELIFVLVASPVSTLGASTVSRLTAATLFATEGADESLQPADWIVLSSSLSGDISAIHREHVDKELLDL